MTRIVTTHHRYKRPPRKRKAVALEAPAIAAARHRATSRVALVAAWLAEKLGQEPAETDRQR
jgi:hypothetical protein